MFPFRADVLQFHFDERGDSEERRKFGEVWKKQADGKRKCAVAATAADARPAPPPPEKNR